MNVKVSTFVTNPTIVQNAFLRDGLRRCIGEDPGCSAIVSLKKECVGKEWELYLEEQLRRRDICFETESDLTRKGKAKTPDILLLIPMAIVISETYHVVNWIDSKGLFADVETFEEHDQQLKGYVNRYGSGVVIYWYGYVSDPVFCSNESIAVVDTFPDLWTSISSR